MFTKPSLWKSVAGALLIAGGTGLAGPALAASRVTIAVTETIASTNPLADSVNLMYGVWCQVYGCMMRYDDKKQDYVSDVFESWKVEDPRTWVFTIKPGLKRHNGEPVVAEDFVHSINRIKTDPQSRQAYNVAEVTEVLVRDPRTVVLKTKNPAAPLPDYLTFVIVMSKAQWDAHGRDADKDAFGIGPYKLKKLVVDNYIVLEKDPNNPEVSADNPDELVFQIMREPEQRVTALFNGEVQIAQFIPPHMVDRVQQNPASKIVMSDSVEAMFVAMSPLAPPFDKKEVRQAVGYAIDRDTIIKRVLQGQATKLNAPVGPGQVGYASNIDYKYTYDPAKSRELLKKAGYPDGVAVDFYATVGRYTLDKQICEAIAQMLNARRLQGHPQDAGVVDTVGQRAEGWRAVLLHGSRLDHRSERDDAAIFRHRRLAANWLFQSRARQAPGQGARDLRPRSADEGAAAGDGGDQRRGAGDFPVAPPDGLGPVQVDRIRARGQRLHLWQQDPRQNPSKDPDHGIRRQV